MQLVAVIGLAFALVIASPAPAADARVDTTAEARFVDSVNAERAARGLPRLQVDVELLRVARWNSDRMAGAGHLSHTPDLGSRVTNWQRVSENVGRGPSVATLHAALMQSHGHRANILDPNVTEIGVGVEVRGSTFWVTQIFRRPVHASQIGFSDVRSGSTHSRDIVRLADSGITVGCGGDRFCPERSVTRAEMATFLARSSGLLPRDPGAHTDVPSSLVHAANIEAISTDGITNGCGEGRYCPDRNVTRAEMASFLVRSADLPTGTSTTRFSDVTAGSTHAADIEALARAGITVGCGGDRYCPDRAVTRAEMASFLVRAFGS